MIRGLIAKTLREQWLATLLFGMALLVVKALLTYVVPHVLDGLDEIWARMPFVKTFVAALLGIDVGEEISARVLQSIVWVHPVVLAIIWAHEITFCTRVPAGEIDRGTIDFLLGLPVPRRMLYLCDSIVWLLSGVVVLACGLIGYLLGSQTMSPETRPELAGCLLVMVNLFGVYVAVGGMAYLASTLCNRQSQAIAIVFTLVVASFLLTFLAQFWEPAGKLAFLSVLHHYQPAEILRTGVLPWADVTSLTIFGVVTWLLGGEILHRRSLCSV